MMKRLNILAVGCTAALLLGWWLGASMQTDTTAPSISGVVYPEPRDMPAFTLTDHHGWPFDKSRFEDKWSFVYLGYTHCPDVCPVTTARMSAAAEQLADEGLVGDVQFFFVSVDPARDTPVRLKEYLSYFDKALVGATGGTVQLDKLASGLGMVYLPVGDTGDDADYTVDHPAAIALINPDARLHAVFTPPHESEALVEGLQRIIAQANSAERALSRRSPP